MRYLILSDIHSNLEALETILEYRAYDRTVCLGDLVGYGANPNEVVDLLRKMDPVATVRGNHDKVACGLDQGEEFVFHARSAAFWTRDQLTQENRDYLSHLPQGPLQVEPAFSISHGSPRDEDDYILSEPVALHNFRFFDTPICLFGHSHIPVVFELKNGNLTYQLPSDSAVIHLDLEGTKYLINPGSVGQPRDGNPRTAFGVLDTGQQVMEFHRLEYPLENAQAKIRRANLPAFLADRLAVGY